MVTLAGLRVEDPAVFDATHEQIRRWVRDDGIDGLRVDHPDGLADPVGYMRALRELAGPDAWLTVEKILEPGEELPRRLAGRRHDRLRRARRGAGACSSTRRPRPRSTRCTAS